MRRTAAPHHRRPLTALLGVAALMLAAGCADASSSRLPTPPASAQPQPATRGATFSVTPKVTGLAAPVWLGAAPGDATGLWVAQQNGQLLRIAGGKRQLKLTIASRTRAAGEQGLLGVAFLPDFARSKLVVLNSTNRAGDTRVELWRIGTSPARAKLVRTLLRVDQPYANHNGGQLTFGPGNTLYVGLGDGGSGDDPQRRAQRLTDKLGKILRATVTATSRPRWRVAAYGLRNPWRFWLDPTANELWVADVGQDQIEEIDRIPLGAATPPNLGWSVFEGGRRNPAGDDRLRGGGRLIWPVATYSHSGGRCSVTGGSIYRGTAVPALRGRYVFGDFCSGELWSTTPTATGVGPLRLERATVPQLSTFGTDAAGELLAASLSGTIYALRPAG